MGILGVRPIAGTYSGRKRLKIPREIFLTIFFFIKGTFYMTLDAVFSQCTYVHVTVCQLCKAYEERRESMAKEF